MSAIGNLIFYFENKNEIDETMENKTSLSRNSKSLYEKNPSKVKRLINDFTELKRPGKQKNAESEKSQTLPRDFRSSRSDNEEVPSPSMRGVKKNSKKNVSTKKEKNNNDLYYLEETVHKSPEEDLEIGMKVKEFGDTLKRKRKQQQEEANSVQNHSENLITLPEKFASLQICKHEEENDDIFGFNTFEENARDNYIVEAYNKTDQELVITTLEITRRTIKPNQFDAGIKHLIGDSDYVIHKNEFVENNDESNTRAHVEKSCNSSDNSSFLYNTLSISPSIYEDEVFYEEPEDWPYSSTYCYNVKSDNIEGATEEETEHFYENMNNFSTCDFTFEEVDSASTPSSLNTPSEKKEKINYIIEEMKKTEELYITGLQMVIEKYIPYLCSNTPQDLIGRTAYLFGNIGDIYKNTKFFLDLMKTCGDDVDCLAEIFVISAPKFELYPLYSKNKPTADIYLKKFDEVIKERQRQLNDKLGLASHLLTPIQRLGKYVLLLEGIQKELRKANRPSENVTAAVNVVRNVMRKGNDFIAIDSIKDSDIDLTTNGSFRMRASFNILKPKKFSSTVFLFENIVVFTEKASRNFENFRYVESIPMSNLSLRKFEDKNNIFHLTNYTKSKRGHPDATFVLEAESPKVKNEWTGVIEKILWSQLEKVREQQKKLSQADTKHSPKTPRSGSSEKVVIRQEKIYRKNGRTKSKSKFYDILPS